MNENDDAARERADEGHSPELWTQPMREALDHVEELTDRAEWGLFQFTGDAWERTLTQIEITAFRAEDEYTEDVRPEHRVRIRFAVTDGVLTVTDTGQRPMTARDLANALDMPWGTALIMSELIDQGLRDALRVYNTVHGQPARGADAGSIMPRPPTGLQRVDPRPTFLREPIPLDRLGSSDDGRSHPRHDELTAVDPERPQDLRVPREWDLPVVHALDLVEQMPGFSPAQVEWGGFRFQGKAWSGPMISAALFAYRVGDESNRPVIFRAAADSFSVIDREWNPLSSQEVATQLGVPGSSAALASSLLGPALQRALNIYNTAHYPTPRTVPAAKAAPVSASAASSAARSQRRRSAGLNRFLGGFPFSRR
ncbi:hypothetical protein [Microbacterium lacticum]